LKGIVKKIDREICPTHTHTHTHTDTQNKPSSNEKLYYKNELYSK